MISKDLPICIIDDNSINRKIFKQILKIAGYTSVDFESGFDAIDWIKNNKTLCVIVDILMPKLSGEEILERVRQLPNGDAIPVIAVTALVHKHEIEKFISQGFDGLIPKPPNMETFATELETIIQEKLDKLS